jgi:hypothetical protein
MRQASKDPSKKAFEVVNHDVFSGLVVCRISVRLLYHILFYHTKIHSEICGFAVRTLQRQNTTTTISGSRQSGSCNQTVSTVPSFSVGVMIRTTHVQAGSECIILHGRCCNGSKAAATRRPSSDSRLYVVQAFHCEIALGLGRM